MFRQQFYLKRIVQVKFNTIISSHSTIEISIIYHQSLFDDRDFLFEFQCFNNFDNNDEVYVHVIDFFLIFVQIWNIIDNSITLLKRIKLNSVKEYQQHKTYIITAIETHFAAKDWQNKWKKNIITLTVVYVVVVNFNMTKTFAISAINKKIHISIKNFNLNLKHVLYNNITTYEQYSVTMKIVVVTNEFSKIWIDQKITINILKEKWMSIFLKSRTDSKLARVYFLKQKTEQSLTKSLMKCILRTN